MSDRKLSILDHLRARAIPRAQRGQCVLKGKQLCALIDKQIEKSSGVFEGPFGVRKVVYCDYTASGRPLPLIEQFISTQIYPIYCNASWQSEDGASDTSCYLGEQMRRLVSDARCIVRLATNASDERYHVLYVGSGCTGAVNCLIRLLRLGKSTQGGAGKKSDAAILVSAYEHHSNLLPWRETGVPVVRMKSHASGRVDLNELRKHLDLMKEQKKRLIICSLTAASNITGIVADFDQVCEMVHQYGGYVFWDYATAAPYIEVDMDKPGLAYKDACFISMHKFLGGMGCPGLLIVNRCMLEQRVVASDANAMGIIRTGLVFRLKQMVGTGYICERDKQIVATV